MHRDGHGTVVWLWANPTSMSRCRAGSEHQATRAVQGDRQRPDTKTVRQERSVGFTAGGHTPSCGFRAAQCLASVAVRRYGAVRYTVFVPHDLKRVPLPTTRQRTRSLPYPPSGLQTSQVILFRVPVHPADHHVRDVAPKASAEVHCGKCGMRSERDAKSTSERTRALYGTPVVAQARAWSWLPSPQPNLNKATSMQLSSVSYALSMYGTGIHLRRLPLTLSLSPRVTTYPHAFPSLPYTGHAAPSLPVSSGTAACFQRSATSDAQTHSRPVFDLCPTLHMPVLAFDGPRTHATRLT